jgi:predicted NAD/FAD-dependent oxidoreductase
MSSRRLATALGDVTVDHGAQYFTARDPVFRQLVQAWQGLGIAAPWPAAGNEAWVGVPAMNAVIKAMADGHDVTWNCQISSITRDDGRWTLCSAAGLSGPFDAVILAIPAEQAAALLSLHDFAMARTALTARSQPCWTGMFVFDQALEKAPPVIRNAGKIAWAARNSAKPGRGSAEAWVVQASADWSRAHFDAAPAVASDLLLAALTEALGFTIPDPVAATAHRWAYALSAGTGDGALWNSEIGLGVCGDWLLGPRVECAWLSGQAMALNLAPAARHPAICEQRTAG